MSENENISPPAAFHWLKPLNEMISQVVCNMWLTIKRFREFLFSSGMPGILVSQNLSTWKKIKKLKNQIICIYAYLTPPTPNYFWKFGGKKKAEIRRNC